MVKIKQVSKTKRHEVARLLEGAILTGQLKPGARLQEMILASELGVSQACIREALLELEGLSLVIKYPNRGSFVMNLTNQDLLQIYQVRRQLEPLACALAAPQLAQEKIEALQDCIREMQTTARKRDYRAYVSADFSFHRLIWESQPNRYLEKSLKAICLPLFAGDLVRRRSTVSYNFDRGVKRHQLILSALRSGDTNLAASVMQRILDRFLRQDLSDYYKLAQVVDKAAGSKDGSRTSLGGSVAIFDLERE
jgi:DNA-binding GntR family transcriptional regulator